VLADVLANVLANVSNVSAENTPDAVREAVSGRPERSCVRKR